MIMCVPCIHTSHLHVYFIGVYIYVCVCVFYLCMLYMCVYVYVYMYIFRYIQTSCTSFTYESIFALFLMYVCCLIYGIPTNKFRIHNDITPAWYMAICLFFKHLLSSYHIPGIFLNTDRQS